jgi:hypothetical protein
MWHNHNLNAGRSMIASSLSLGFANAYGIEWVTNAMPGWLGVG